MNTTNGESKQSIESLSAQERFWQAAEQEQLILPRCSDTGKCFFYPRDHSPFTGGSIDWVKSKGLGAIYSYCLSGRGEAYCLAYIQLDDGPIMLSNVISEDLSSVEIGQRVKVCFLQDEQGRKVPFFKIIEAL